MIPRDQTRLHDRAAGVTGDCLAACLASILEVPVEGWPIMPPLEEARKIDWGEPFREYALRLGMHLNWMRFREGGFPPGWSVANGKSPRGVGHSVVAWDGRLLFDPHPSRAGLVGVVEDYVVLWPTSAETAALLRKPFTPRAGGGDRDA